MHQPNLASRVAAIACSFALLAAPALAGDSHQSKDSSSGHASSSSHSSSSHSSSSHGHSSHSSHGSKGNTLGIAEGVLGTLGHLNSQNDQGAGKKSDQGGSKSSGSQNQNQNQNQQNPFGAAGQALGMFKGLIPH